MIVNCDRRTINLINTPIKENAAIWVEQDILVPDSKPDVMKIINMNVTPYISSYEIENDRIKLNGTVSYFVIYKTSDNLMGTRGMYMTYPLSMTVNVKNINKDMDIRVNVCTKNVIYSLPNERKLSVKSEIVCDIEYTEMMQLNIIEKFSDDLEMQTKSKSCKCMNMIKTVNNVIASTEDVMIPKECNDFYEILKVTTKIINEDYKESYNKIMVKGDISIDVVYLSELETTDIKIFNMEIPFSGMIEFDNISDKSKFDIEYTMNNFLIKLNPDMISSKTMNVEYQIGVSAKMYEEDEITYIEDFYSEKSDLKINSKIVSPVYNTNILNKLIDVKEYISDVVVATMKLLDYSMDTNHLNIKTTSSDINVDGNLKLSMLLQNTETLEVESKVIDILVSEKIPVDSSDVNSLIKATTSIEKLTVNLNGKDAEIKLKLNVKIIQDQIMNMNYSESIEAESLDLDKLDSMYLYIVKPNDTLWDISKKYKTTMEKVMKTNNIEKPEMINVNDKILIIR